MFSNQTTTTGVECRMEKDNDMSFIKPGEDTGNISNLVLLYNGWYEKGKGDWVKDNIIPYISYVNENMEPKDWFFDGVLYLGLKTPEHKDFGDPNNPTRMKDWIWYLDKTFREKGDLSELNEAVKEVGAKLGQPECKYKVVLMIPYPAATVGEFGDINGDGISESFKNDEVGTKQAFENRKEAVRWFVELTLERWKQSEFSNLELTGLFWLSECVVPDTPYEEDLIRYTSSLVHKNKLIFYWIPWFDANGYFKWKELGFDAAAYQPNHFFHDTPPSHIKKATLAAKKYGMGVEFECDERMNGKDKKFCDKYMDYLNGGVECGYMMDTFKAYYQGNFALLDAAMSNDPEIRKNYDLMYQFVKGTYSIL